MPFGLCTSPYVFTKIMKPVMNALRIQGLLSVIYLDDILCIGRTYNLCKLNLERAVSLLKKLGFLLNYKKSCLEHSQKCKYLGFIIDSEKFQLELPKEKTLRIFNLLDHFNVSDQTKIRDFAKLLGTLNSCCPAVTYSLIHCKRLERAKYLALLLQAENYDANMTIENNLQEDLLWWKQNILSSNNPIRSR